MIRVISICAIVIVAAIGYTQLITASAHDQAISNLKQ